MFSTSVNSHTHPQRRSESQTGRGRIAPTPGGLAATTASATKEGKWEGGALRNEESASHTLGLKILHDGMDIFREI